MDINSVGGAGFPEKLPSTFNNGLPPLPEKELDQKVSAFKEIIGGELKKVERSLSRLSRQLSQEIRQNPSSTATLVASYREKVKAQIENFSQNLSPEAQEKLKELAPSHENEVMKSIQNELFKKYSAPNTAVNTLLSNSNSSTLTQLCNQFLATSDVNSQEQIFDEIQMALGGGLPSSQSSGSPISGSDQAESLFSQQNELLKSNALPANEENVGQTPEPPPPAFSHPLPPGTWVVPFRIDPPPGTQSNQVYISINQPFYNSKGDLVSTGTKPVLLSTLDYDAIGPYLYLPSGSSGNIVIGTTPINADPPPSVGTASAPYGMWEYTNKTDANGIPHINVDYSNVDNLSSSGAITFWNKGSQGGITPTMTGSTGAWFPMVQQFSEDVEKYGQQAGWTQAMINAVVNGVGSGINGIAPKHFAEEFFVPNFNCYFKNYLQNTLFKPGATGSLIAQGIQFTTRDGLFTLNGLTSDGQSLHFVNQSKPSETIDIPLNLNSGLGWFSGGCCGDWQQFTQNGTAQDLIRDLTGIVNLGMTAQSIKTFNPAGVYDPVAMGEWVSKNPQDAEKVFYQNGVPYNVYERSVHEAGFNSYAFDYDECSGQSSDQDNLPSNVDHVTISWGSWSDHAPDPGNYPPWAKSLMSALNPTPSFKGEKKKLADALLSWINRQAIQNPSQNPSIGNYFMSAYPTNPTNASQDIYMQYPGISVDDVADICKLIGVTNPPLPTPLDSLVSRIGLAVNSASMGGDALDFAQSIESEIYSLYPTDPASMKSFNQWIQNQCANIYLKYPDLIPNSTQVLWVTQIALSCNVVLPSYNKGSLPAWAQPYQNSLNQLNVSTEAGLSYRNFLLNSLYCSGDLKSYQGILSQFCSNPQTYVQDFFFHFPGIDQSDLNQINGFYKSVSVPAVAPTEWDTYLSYLIDPTQAPPSANPLPPLSDITTPQGIATQEALINFILGQSNPSSSYDLNYAHFSKLAQQFGLVPSNPDYKTICSALGITPPPPSPLAAYITDIDAWMQDQNPGVQALGNAILQYINSNSSLTPQQLISYLNTTLASISNSKDIYLQYPGLTDATLGELCTSINQTYGSAGVNCPSATSMDKLFFQAWDWQPQASGAPLKQDLLNEILSLGSSGTQATLTSWAQGIRSSSADYKNASLVDQTIFCQITSLQPPTSLTAYIIDINTWMKGHNSGVQGLGNAILQYINSNPSLTPQQLISYLNTTLASISNSKDIYLQYPGLTDATLGELCTSINQTYGSAGVNRPSATSMDQLFFQAWDWQPQVSGVALKQDLLNEILSLGSLGTQAALTTWAQGIRSGSSDYRNASPIDQSTFSQITNLPPPPSGTVPPAIISEINTYYGNFTNLYRVLQAMNIPGFTNIFGPTPQLNLPSQTSAEWNLLIRNMSIRCSQNPNPAWVSALQFAQAYSSPTQYNAGGALFSAVVTAANQPGETSQALLTTLGQLQKQYPNLSIQDEAEVNRLIGELSQ